MKKKTPVLFATLGVLTFLAMAAQEGPLKDTPEDTSKNTTLAIEGMTCGGCVAAVKLKLKKTEGVLSYEVSLEKGEAKVSYDPAKTNPMKIAAAASETGFKAKVKEEKKPQVAASN